MRPWGWAVLVGSAGAVAVLATQQVVERCDRERLRTTLSMMRSIEYAIESYQAEGNSPPAASSFDDLGRVLEPTYIHTLARSDAWGHKLAFLSWEEDPPLTGRAYAIASPGKDGRWEVADFKRCPSEPIFVIDQTGPRSALATTSQRPHPTSSTSCRRGVTAA